MSYTKIGGQKEVVLHYDKDFRFRDKSNLDALQYKSIVNIEPIISIFIAKELLAQDCRPGSVSIEYGENAAKLWNETSSKEKSSKEKSSKEKIHYSIDPEILDPKIAPFAAKHFDIDAQRSTESQKGDVSGYIGDDRL